MCSYFIRRGQCRAEPSRCIRTAHLLSWEDWPSQKRNKTCAYAVAFTAKHRHYHTTTAHTNKREDRSSFWLMLCVGTLNLFFFNSIFVFVFFFKKKRTKSRLLHHQHISPVGRNTSDFEERKKIAILETIDKKKENNAPLSSYAYIAMLYPVRDSNAIIITGNRKRPKKAIFLFISSSLLFSLSWRN